MNTNVIKTPQSAQYGSETQYGNTPVGQVSNAGNASADAMAQLDNNDSEQVAVANGQKSANGLAAGAASRGAQAYEDPTAANNQASGANGNQAGAIELARRQAMGQGISPAAQQLQTGLAQGLNQQTAIGQSGRGFGALATQGSEAAGARANLQQNAYTAGGMLRSQDMAQGRGLYGSMTSDARSQDASALSLADQFSQANQQRNDNYALGMGQVGVDLGNVNNGQNVQDLNDYSRGMQPLTDQDEANQQHQLWLADAHQQATAANKDN